MDQGRIKTKADRAAAKRVEQERIKTQADRVLVHLAFSVHQDHTAASGKRNAPHAEQGRIKAQAARAAA